MPEITDKDSLKAWLNTRPSEDARLIAARAASRGLPGLARLFESERVKDPFNIILPVFRASAVASVVGKWPTQQQGMQASADSARSAARSALSAHSAARSAAHSALSALSSLSSLSANSAANSAAWNADSAFSAAAWNAVESDVNLLADGAEHGEISDLPLWHRQDPPEGLAEAWPTLRDRLLQDDPLWHVWTDWYQDRLNGKPMIEALEVEKALIPDADWNEGPAHVNAIIAGMIERYAAKAAPKPTATEIDLDALLAARDLRAALADFELDDFAKLIRMVPFANDVKTLNDPALEQARAEMLSELADLMGDLGRDCQKQLSPNAPDYVRLAANRYQREARQGVGSVRPGRLWDVGLELAGALKDIEVETSFPEHLFNRLDHAVSKHRDLMREYFAGALARLRPLDKIEPAPDTSREDAVAALEQSVDGLDAEDWGSVPPPDPEIAAEMADRVDELKDIMVRIERTTDPDKARDLEQTFWRKTKAAMLTVMRFGVSAAKFTSWSAGTAAAFYALFPTEFAAALQVIQRILGSVPWL